MACGVPCVGTRVEAVPEIVAHGETGLLVPPGDAVALAARSRLGVASEPTVVAPPTCMRNWRRFMSN